MQRIAFTPLAAFSAHRAAGKLDSASRAFSVSKNADAVQKLTDFLNKVTTLKNQGKLLSADADPAGGRGTGCDHLPQSQPVAVGHRLRSS